MKVQLNADLLATVPTGRDNSYCNSCSYVDVKSVSLLNVGHDMSYSIYNHAYLRVVALLRMGYPQVRILGTKPRSVQYTPKFHFLCVTYTAVYTWSEWVTGPRWLTVSMLTSHQDRAKSPAGSLEFRKWESCRKMPLVGGFSQGSLVSPAPSFRPPLHIHFNHPHRLSRPRFTTDRRMIKVIGCLAMSTSRMAEGYEAAGGSDPKQGCRNARSSGSSFIEDTGGEKVSCPDSFEASVLRQQVLRSVFQRALSHLKLASHARPWTVVASYTAAMASAVVYVIPRDSQAPLLHVRRPAQRRKPQHLTLLFSKRNEANERSKIRRILKTSLRGNIFAKRQVALPIRTQGPMNFVASHLTLRDSLLVPLQVGYWSGAVQGVSNKLCSNCKGDFSVHAFEIYLTKAEDSNRYSQKPGTDIVRSFPIPVTDNGYEKYYSSVIPNNTSVPTNRPASRERYAAFNNLSNRASVRRVFRSRCGRLETTRRLISSDRSSTDLLFPGITRQRQLCHNRRRRIKCGIATSPTRVIDVSMEQRRNKGLRRKGDPQENPPNSGIVRHDPNMGKSGIGLTGD
ncbi:hypothetical protein PR048_027235 [Dryococelus australis]|uniref:Uncharacterized protein n=1 Tax=Dryococelus australis TaxID=614101 RepID=A0ABQ9GF45_9NEOP|nr:hypothetical protein PR048_027235 [Dryococelus australis]